MKRYIVYGIQWNSVNGKITFLDSLIMEAKPRVTARRMLNGIVRIRLWRRKALIYECIVYSWEFDRNHFKPIYEEKNLDARTRSITINNNKSKNS